MAQWQEHLLFAEESRFNHWQIQLKRSQETSDRRALSLLEAMESGYQGLT